jgi:hypothetical protein
VRPTPTIGSRPGRRRLQWLAHRVLGAIRAGRPTVGPALKLTTVELGLSHAGGRLGSHTDLIQFAEQVGEDCVPLDRADLQDQVPERVVAPGTLVGQQRAVHGHGRHPLGIDQPGDRAEVPQRPPSRRSIGTTVGLTNVELWL